MWAIKLTVQNNTGETVYTDYIGGKNEREYTENFFNTLMNVEVPGSTVVPNEDKTKFQSHNKDGITHYELVEFCGGEEVVDEQ